MSLFLTYIELQELTGYKLASKQTSWLQARGYYTEINARGIPKITYTQVEDMRRQKTLFQANTGNSNGFLVNSASVITNTQIANGFALEPNLNQLRNKISKVVTNG